MPFFRKAAEALRLAGPEAVLTSHSSAYLYGCLAADQAPVHVLIRDARRVRSRAGVTVHHGTFHGRDVETLYGLNVLVLEHALADVLCRGDPWIAVACLDQAMAKQGCRRSFTERVMQAVRTRADPRGRRAAEVMLRARCPDMA
jgi:hypothetical protein